MKPLLRVSAEFGEAPPDLAQLKKEIETKIRPVLTVSSSVELVPRGTLPRFEMKGQLVKKLYEK